MALVIQANGAKIPIHDAMTDMEFHSKIREADAYVHQTEKLKLKLYKMGIGHTPVEYTVDPASTAKIKQRIQITGTYKAVYERRGGFK